MAPNQRLLLTLLVPFLLSITATAHGDHYQAPLNPEDANDWATAHMISEHHISNFDPASFFSLHDYDSDSMWEAQEIRRTYGLAEGSTDGMGGEGALAGTTEEKKQEVVNKVLELFDADRNGFIDKQEWMNGIQQGNRLPDFGLGPGHHGDDEYEYEIHHFERFHDENTREEDLTHPEDIAHFRKHDQMDDAADRQAEQDSMRIVPNNIPSKFRRDR